MKPNQLYLSTIDAEAGSLASAWGLGLEIADFCTAGNLDNAFPETDEKVRRALKGIPSRLLHAPFNELFPCAIDPRARELARYRYRQAIDLARRYGAAKVVIHGGFNPGIYFPCWYTEQSVLFWREFLREDPGMELCLENVMEPEPELLEEILRQVDHPRLRLCLDVGHCNVYSKIPVARWLEALAPWISHFHIHNNTGEFDTHNSLDTGAIPMEPLLREAEGRCPGATFTVEVPEAESSLVWLRDQGILEECIWKPN